MVHLQPHRTHTWYVIDPTTLDRIAFDRDNQPRLEQRYRSMDRASVGSLTVDPTRIWISVQDTCWPDRERVRVDLARMEVRIPLRKPRADADDDEEDDDEEEESDEEVETRVYRVLRTRLDWDGEDAVRAREEEVTRDRVGARLRRALRIQRSLASAAMAGLGATGGEAAWSPSSVPWLEGPVSLPPPPPPPLPHVHGETATGGDAAMDALLDRIRRSREELRVQNRIVSSVREWGGSWRGGAATEGGTGEGMIVGGRSLRQSVGEEARPVLGERLRALRRASAEMEAVQSVPARSGDGDGWDEMFI